MFNSDDLEGMAEELADAGRKEGRWSRFKRWPSRNPVKLGGLLSLAALGGAGLANMDNDEEKLKKEYFRELENARFQGSFNDYVRMRGIPLEREVGGMMHDREMEDIMRRLERRRLAGS